MTKLYKIYNEKTEKDSKPSQLSITIIKVIFSWTTN